MIKCIVCDLDGTLMKEDDSMEENTWKSLKKCIDSGIEFIIATGRDINMVVDFLDKYHLDCDLILNNGAQYCKRDMSLNEIYPMDDESFKKIVNILFGYGYLLAIHTNNGKYSLVDEDKFWTHHMKLLDKFYEGKVMPLKTFTTKKGYLRDFHYVKSVDDIINQGVKGLKIDARHLNPSSIQGVRKQLNIDHLDISSSYEDNIEITSDTSNKGKTLDHVISLKGYKNDEIAVFGDSDNDVHMLEKFKYSFAPKNANDSAKKAAKYKLTTTCEEGAVKEGLDILKDLHLL